MPYSPRHATNSARRSHSTQTPFSTSANRRSNSRLRTSLSIRPIPPRPTQSRSPRTMSTTRLVNRSILPCGGLWKPGRAISIRPTIPSGCTSDLKGCSPCSAAILIGARMRPRCARTSVNSPGPMPDDRKLVLAVGPSYFDATGTAHCGSAAAPIASCVPLNLFGPPGSLTPAMLDYIDAFETNRTKGQSINYAAQMNTSDLFDLPAGPLGFATGVDHRRESGAALLDPLESSGNVNGNGNSSSSTSGAYSVSEAYIEFDAPLLAGKPFARKLDAVIGSRYSHYSNFGGTTNSQLGLRWKPIDDLLVRANTAQGFRAPAITELFQGAEQSQGGITRPLRRDQCRGSAHACGARALQGARGTGRCRFVFCREQYHPGWQSRSEPGDIIIKWCRHVSIRHRGSMALTSVSTGTTSACECDRRPRRTGSCR